MKKLSAISAALGLALLSQTSIAKSDINVDHLLQNADMVMQGEIVDIQYKDSKEGLPHTFVTYQVNEMIAGDTANKIITLRFIGGEQKKGDVIRHLSVSEVPEFEKGESDILFIRKNNTSICPLVKCSNGRFRDLNGLVTNENGQPLLMNAKSEFKLGQQSMVEQMPSTNSKGRFKKGLSNASGEAAPTQMQKNASHLDTLTFIAKLKERSQELRSTGKMSKKTMFKSSKSNEAFSTPLFKASKPADHQPTLSAKGLNNSRAKSEFDKWEEKMIKANGGEPVLEVPARFKKSK